MTKFQFGLLIGFFLGALVTFVTLGMIQFYMAEQHERRHRGLNRSALEPEADAQSMFYSAPMTKSCLAPEPHSPTAIKMPEDEEERIVFLSIFIE